MKRLIKQNPHSVGHQRRSILKGGLGLAAVSMISSPAWAQNKWPTRPVRVIVPFSAGGAADTSARTISSAVADLVGQSFVIENRTGGNGAITESGVWRFCK